jgi:hypothetical protein
MSETSGKPLAGPFGTPRIAAEGDDAFAGLEELCAHGDEALEVLEEAAEEIAEDVFEADVDATVRKAFDDFPADVQCQHLPDDVGVTPRVVEPTDDSYLSRIRHERLLQLGAPPHPARDRRPNDPSHLPGPLD